MPEKATGLTCPKCAGDMRNYERNGVHIDQCADCRGIFLDRGELDRLIDAESAFDQTERQQPAPGQPSAPVYHQQPHGQQQYGEKHRDDRQHGGYRKKRRGSFFEELFD